MSIDTDIERHGSVAFELARRLAQYQANRTALFEWIAPSWLAQGWRQSPGTTSESGVRLRARAVAAWLDRQGTQVPVCGAFRGDEGLLGALALDDALGALCLRALYFRRAELRYWVDRESREKVADWLGRRGTAALRWLMESPHAKPIDRLIRECGMQPLDHLDEYQLSWEGFCLFGASGLCAPASPVSLLRYAWPRDSIPPPWLDMNDADAVREDSVRVLQRLEDFFAKESTT